MTFQDTWKVFRHTEKQSRPKTKKGSFTTDMIVICPKQGESGKSLPCKAFSGSSAQRDKCTSAQRDTETREGGEMCTVHYSGEKLRRNEAKTKSNKAKHTPMVVSVKPTITEQGRRQINFAWGKERTLKYQVFCPSMGV